MSSGYPVEPSPPGGGDDRPPIWDALGVRWDWVDERQHYVCSDPHFPGPEITHAGALPDDRQPPFAHPPNAAQLAAVELQRELGERP